MKGQSKFRLVLASSSPRRRELLSYLNIPFELFSPDIEEMSEKSRPVDVALDLAKQKADFVAEELFERYECPLILACDTIVCLENDILGKPQNDQQAFEFLRKLSGQTHLVITGCHLLGKNIGEKRIFQKSFYAQTSVTFDRLSDARIRPYVESGDGLDKAGGYGIQGPAVSFIKEIHGSYSNVVGLPVDQCYREIMALLD